MTAGFSFELGVFKNAFVPTAGNTAEWAANWVPAQRAGYDPVAKRFSNSFTVFANNPPFTAGAKGYVWGFKGGVAASEWILLGNAQWTWPAPDPFNNFGVDWDAAAATAVIGTVNAGGSPFLMKSALVSNAASPATSWPQWREAAFGDLTAGGPEADPDSDGVVNLLEYVFGSPPLQAGAVPVTPTTLVEDGGQKFMQITIPRRVDHLAVLTVEVSPDLAQWQSGVSHTRVVENSASALVVRDLTPVNPSNPRRFMRLKAALP